MGHHEYMKAIDACENNIRAAFSGLHDQEKPIWQMEAAIRKAFASLRMEIDERFRRPLPKHREHYWQTKDIMDSSVGAAKAILFGYIRENEGCVASAPVAIVNAIRKHYGATKSGWGEADNEASRSVEVYLRQEVVPRMASAIAIEMARAETDQFVRVELGHKL